MLSQRVCISKEEGAMAPAAKKTQQPAVCHGHSRPIVEVNYR